MGEGQWGGKREGGRKRKKGNKDGRVEGGKKRGKEKVCFVAYMYKYSCYATYKISLPFPPVIPFSLASSSFSPSFPSSLATCSPHPPHRLVTLIEEEQSGTDLVSEAVITLGSFAHGRTVPRHFYILSSVDIEVIQCANGNTFFR